MFSTRIIDSAMSQRRKFFTLIINSLTHCLFIRFTFLFENEGGEVLLESYEKINGESLSEIPKV